MGSSDQSIVPLDYRTLIVRKTRLTWNESYRERSNARADAPHPVRANLQAGGNVYGTMAFEFFSPGLMAILAEAEADFVLLDTEHSGVGIETIKAQLRGLRIVPMVRVRGCHYHLIAPVLDATFAHGPDIGRGRLQSLIDANVATAVQVNAGLRRARSRRGQAPRLGAPRSRGSPAECGPLSACLRTSFPVSQR